MKTTHTKIIIAAALFICTSFGKVLEYGELTGNYMLYVPTKSSDTLIVALHGSGERDYMYIDNWKKEAEKHNFFVLAPNAGNRDGWSLMDVPHVLDLVRTIKKEYQIKHTLLNGASAGGHFALYLGISNYDDFDAIATFMGLAITSLGELIIYQPDAKKQVPILLIHGLKDKMIPINYARQNYAYLKDKEYPVTYIEEKDMIHEFYRKDNEKIIDWFLKVAK